MRWVGLEGVVLLGKLNGMGFPLCRQGVEVVLHGVVLATSGQWAGPQCDTCKRQQTNKQTITKKK